ncbi:unnamed protein product [Ectocarpus sp. 6 AP-2014]
MVCTCVCPRPICSRQLQPTPVCTMGCVHVFGAPAGVAQEGMETEEVFVLSSIIDMKTIQSLFRVCVHSRHCCCALFTSDLQRAIVFTSEILKPTAQCHEVTNYCCHRPSAWKSESVHIRTFTKRHASTSLSLIGLRVSFFLVVDFGPTAETHATKKTTTRSPLPASI